MLTPFGKCCRDFRVTKGLRLIDVAGAMGFSAAFFSAVETGKKAIPKGFVDAVATAMKLSAKEKAELQSAADRSATVVKVDSLSESDRELVAAFARQVDGLDEAVIAEIRRKLMKSMNGELPFQRKRRGMVVTPRSANWIWDLADQVRAKANVRQAYFPIIEFLEFVMPSLFPDFYLEVAESKVMGADEGRVVAGKNKVTLRDDVYDDACNGEGRARFTACHELGHFLMHRNVSLARTRTDAYPIYQDSEWQADAFAGGLLLSRQHWKELRFPEYAEIECGMSQHAARVMAAKYRKH